MKTELELAKEKAVAIINSCVTCDHFDNAIPYIKLVYQQFGDEEVYNELFQLYTDKFNELQCNIDE
jgi:hypothetical protein